MNKPDKTSCSDVRIFGLFLFGWSDSLKRTLRVTSLKGNYLVARDLETEWSKKAENLSI